MKNDPSLRKALNVGEENYTGDQAYFYKTFTITNDNHSRGIPFQCVNPIYPTPALQGRFRIETQ